MRRRIPAATATALAAAATAVAIGVIGATSEPLRAESDNSCAGLPTYTELKEKLQQASFDTAYTGTNRGFGNNMWATIVNRDGVVCAVAFTGSDRGAQWPGSRVISAQKANTANSFTLASLALSTANLYPLVQPGASLFGLQESNPVATDVAYKGPSSNYGQPNDPMVGSKIGGVNVFGGGLGLYADGSRVIGGLGVSGDTSCADHNIAWTMRQLLGLNHTPSAGADNIAYPAHPKCLGGETPPPGQ
jgi:uncharacterized protein GlcG (DUF336 family)